MGLDSKMEIVMVNKYPKFQLDIFDSNEVIEVCKNFNLNFYYFLSIKGA